MQKRKISIENLWPKIGANIYISFTTREQNVKAIQYVCVCLWFNVAYRLKALACSVLFVCRNEIYTKQSKAFIVKLLLVGVAISQQIKTYQSLQICKVNKYLHNIQSNLQKNKRSYDK